MPQHPRRRALLQELGAFDGAGALTEIGSRLARLPLDPASAG
jgi:HrpA-like RNA helicase